MAMAEREILRTCEAGVWGRVWLSLFFFFFVDPSWCLEVFCFVVGVCDVLRRVLQGVAVVVAGLQGGSLRDLWDAGQTSGRMGCDHGMRTQVYGIHTRSPKS